MSHPVVHGGHGPVMPPQHGVPLVESAKMSAMKGLAFYAALAYTPIPSFFSVGAVASAGTAALIFTVVDVIRRSFIDPQLPVAYRDWAHAELGPGGDYMDPAVLWQNLSWAAMCKACIVQSVLFWGVLSFSGSFSGSAAGIAATSFVSTVLYDFVKAFMKH